MAAWGIFRHQLPKLYWQSAAIYQQDELSQVNNNLLTNDLKWTDRQNFRWEASLDGGMSQDQNNNHQQKGGVLASLSVTGVLHKKLSFSSSNTFSTAYYPGQRKGAQVISERLSYRLGKLGMWTAYNYYHYNPKTVSSVYNYQSMYGSSRAEIGLSTNLGKVSLSFAPYYSTNSSRYFALNTTINPKITAWRTQTQVSYSQQLFSAYISGDIGFGKNSLTDKKELQWHMNSSLRYGFFNISGSMQVGSYYATDALNSYIAGSPTYKIVTVTPRIQHAFFHRTLDFNAGLSYNYINSSGKNLSMDARVQYKISSGSSLAASFIRYSTGYSNTAYNSLQLNFTTALPTMRVGTRQNSLELLFYKDVNDNGVYDKGIDSLAIGQQVSINQTRLLTDKNGRVLYRNLPSGSYNIGNMRSDRWYSVSQVVVLTRKKQTLSIPLHKIGMVEGNVRYSYSKFSYEVNRQKQGLTIKAVDNKGTVYTTLTDDYGHYILYLPTGLYSVYVDPSYLPSEVECAENTASRNFQVQSSSLRTVDFTLHVKERKIETKKFFSASLAKTETAKNEVKPKKETKQIAPSPK